jgi:S1-C subfamily serine protease
MKHAPLIILTALLPFSIWAADLARIEVPGSFGSKVYENVTIIGATAQGIKVSHSAGIAVIPRSAFPPEWQAKLPAPASPAPAPTSTPKPASQPSTGEPQPPTSPQPSAPSGSNQALAATVLISGTNGVAGTGFFLEVADKHYIYTAAHVLTSAIRPKFTTATGEQIQITLANPTEVSDDPDASDVARIQLLKPQAVVFSLAAEVTLDSPIEAFGNSGGGNVITKEPGLVKGVSANEIEIDAKVVPGNSGGPVVIQGTTMVAGLVTRAISTKTDIWKRDTRYADVRRFALRPQSVKKWIPFSLEGLQKLEATLDTIRAETRVIAAAVFLNYYRDGIYAPDEKKGDYIIRQIIAEGTTTPGGRVVSAAINELNTVTRKGSGGRVNLATVRQAYSKFFSSTASITKADLFPDNRTQYIQHLRTAFDEELDLRQRIVAELKVVADKVVTTDLLTKAEADAIAARQALQQGGAPPQ